MTEYDLALAWEWPYDASFVARVLTRSASHGMMALAITSANLQSALHEVAEGRLRFRWLFDRAADERPEFLPLTSALERAGTGIINHVQHQSRAIDKARSHLLLAAHGVPVPFTVIVPSFAGDPSPPSLPVALGRPFVAKPSGGGGGAGVELGVSTVQDVQNARRVFWGQRYLLQQRVAPRQLDGRRAWFRVFYAFGRVIPCWWDDASHVYTPLAAAEELHYGLRGIREIMMRISRIVGLDLFTTEIVLGSDGRLVCVDYANSPCDLRLQSEHHDGVPDEVVEQVIDALLAHVEAWPERTEVWQPAAG